MSSRRLPASRRVAEGLGKNNRAVAFRTGVRENRTLLAQAVAGRWPRALGAAVLAGAASPAWTQAGPDNVAEMETVVVTASGFEQNVVDAPASISVIPREKLEQGMYRDLNDALRDIPGVIITSNSDNNGRGDISLRGMGSAYTLILVDGKRTNTKETQTNGSTGTDQGWVPPLEAIERIEVVRGPMSSLYGSDAMGGVVNIITRKVAKQWTGSVRAETTMQQHSDSGDEHSTNFYLSGPIKTDLLGLSIYGTYAHRDEDRIYEGYNKGRTHGATVKLALTPTRDHDIVLEGEKYKQRYESRVNRTIENVPDSRGNLPEDLVSYYDRERFAITHNGRWTPKLLTDTYVQREDTKNIRREMTIKNTVANTSLTYLFDRHTVVAGAYYEENKLSDNTGNTISDRSNADRWKYAFFAEDEWRVTDSFALTGGLRYDKVQEAGDHWSPRIYGVYHLTDNWSLKGGVSTGFKAPNIRQMISDWGQTSRGGNMYGNPNLKPEKSLSKEIGILYNADSGLSASLMLFDNAFKDKITRVPCPACGPANAWGRVPTTYENVDEAVTRGVEAALSVPVTAALDVNASYTYTYSKQKTGEYAGNPLNQLPKHLFTLGTNWRVTGQFTTWTRLQFRGKESDPTAGPSSSTIVSPSYTLFDLGGSYKFNRTVTLHAGIYNLFDKRIDVDRGYGFVEDGRRFWLGVDVKF